MIRFIHIPKTAGTTVGKWLRRNDIDHIIGESLNRYSRHWPMHRCTTLLDAWSFAVVRSPFTRTCSYWRWMQRLPNYRDISFEQFCREKTNWGRVRQAWIPQTWWTHDSSNRIIVDAIIRMEELPHALWDLFGIRTKLGRLNTTSGPTDEELHTKETLAIVREHFAADLEQFGYDPNSGLIIPGVNLVSRSYEESHNTV